MMPSLSSAPGRPRHGYNPSRALLLSAGALLVAACGDLQDDGPTAPDDPRVGAERPATPPGLDGDDLERARKAVDRHAERLMRNPMVVGVGVGLNPAGKPSVRISLLREEAEGIPDHVDDVPVHAQVTGMFSVDVDREDRVRPAPMGFSVGHPDITAGTLGARVIDDDDNTYILSNNYILANSNDADIGDATLQPGPTDGGSEPDDVIGTLADFEEISFEEDNVMDAAIAAVDASLVSGTTPEGEAYGAPGTSPQEATLGMDVQKYGRTTGHTHGEVDIIDYEVEVCFETRGPFQCAASATFTEQIAVSPGDFSEGGDSGSLIVTDDDADPVGLLFAGSDTHTIANPIGEVLARFDVDVDAGEAEEEPDEPEEGTIEGTVTDADDDGNGLEGAEVAVEETDLTATTYGDGSYTLDEVPEGTHEVTASAEGYEPLTEEVVVEAGEEVTQNFALDRVDDDGEVEAEPEITDYDVSTRSAGPWARADVEWSVSHEDGALESVTTELLDADGDALDSETSSVSGHEASGLHELRTRDDADEVRITVVDTEGNTAETTVDY